MKRDDSYPILTYESQADWEAWLSQHHASADGVWMKIAKKSSGIASIDYPQALESALIYGWIDGLRRAYDQHYFLQKFTPRRPQSLWSQVNRQKVEALIAAGRMQPAGLREVELAQADGRWEAAYPSQQAMQVPEDFQSELDRHPAALEFFNSLNKANRYAILFQIKTAKRPETRAARIARMLEMLIKQEKLY